MQVQFRNTDQALVALNQQLPLGKRVWWKVRGPVLLLAVFLPLAVALLAFGYVKLVVSISLLAGLPLMALFLVRFLKRPKIDPNLLTDTTLVITPQYLESRDDNGQGRRDWSLVDRCEESSDYLFIFLAKNVAIVIPKSAFADSGQAEQFASLARDYIQRAAGSQDDRLQQDATFLESLSPCESIGGMEIRFQSTREQVVEYLRFGLPGRSQWSGQFYFIVATLVLLGIILLSPRTSTSGRWQSIALLAVGALSFGALIFLVSWLKKREARQNCHEYLRPQSITISQAGVAGCDPLLSTWNNWQVVDSVLHSDRFILITGGGLLLHLIPTAAFESPDHAREFVTLATQYQRDALAGEQTTDLPPLEETGNPYQPPSQA